MIGRRVHVLLHLLQPFFSRTLNGPLLGAAIPALAVWTMRFHGLDQPNSGVLRFNHVNLFGDGDDAPSAVKH